MCVYYIALHTHVCCVSCLCECVIHLNILTRRHVWRVCVSVCITLDYTYTQTCVCVCYTWLYLHTDVCVTCVWVCIILTCDYTTRRGMCVYMYACTCVCVYVLRPRNDACCAIAHVFYHFSCSFFYLVLKGVLLCHTYLRLRTYVRSEWVCVYIHSVCVCVCVCVCMVRCARPLVGSKLWNLNPEFLRSQT